MFVERDVDGHERSNPFRGDLALANSAYAGFYGKHLVHLPSCEPTSPLMEFVHDSFRALVLSSRFSCVGAKAAIRSGAYRAGLYDALGSTGATAGLARDLFSFVEEQKELGGAYTTFVASFAGPNVADEAVFERLLWAQLRLLHEEDLHHHGWDASVSSDPEDPDFAFSFAERAFFSSGSTRRAPASHDGSPGPRWCSTLTTSSIGSARRVGTRACRRSSAPGSASSREP